MKNNPRLRDPIKDKLTTALAWVVAALIYGIYGFEVDRNFFNDSKQPSVFQRRVQLGYYDEEGHRLQPEGFATDKKSKRRKVA